MKKVTYLKYEKDADREYVEYFGFETKNKISWRKIKSNSSLIALILYHLKDLMNSQ